MEVVAGGVAAGLYGYNRKNYLFDGMVKQRREYQGQAMRIKQFELYREDIRDLVELTTSKMDKYIVVNTLCSGFCIKLFCEGRPRPGLTADWLQWLYAVTTASAMMYFLLSVWLAMQASVAAHSFGVRLLTQIVRLPLASEKELDAARFHAQDFEGASMGEMMRLPVLKQQLKNLNMTMDQLTQSEGVPGDAAAAADRGPQDATGQAEDAQVDESCLEHVKLYRQVQTNWQAYDAYARVCMAAGTNQLLFAMNYYCMVLFTMEERVIWAALGLTMVYCTCSYLIARLDLFISRKLLSLVTLVLFLPPAMTLVMAYSATPWLPPLIFLTHLCWVSLQTYLARADSHGDTTLSLPLLYRAVLYLDVYGWNFSAQNMQPGGVDQAQAFQSQRIEGREQARQAEQLPDGARVALLQHCARLQEDLRMEFFMWDSGAVVEALAENASGRGRLAASRARFVATVQELQGLSGSSSSSAEPLPPTEEGAVWLKLAWVHDGRPMDFFLRWDDGDTSYGEPSNASRITDLDKLEEQVQAFQQRVSSAAAGARGPVPSTQTPSPRTLTPTAGEVLTEPSSSFAHSAPLLSVQTLDARLGGEEAARLSDFRAAAATAATFTPGQDRGAPQASAPLKPGQVPWRTFLHGSMAVFAVWCIGFVWISISMVVGATLPMGDQENGHPGSLTESVLKVVGEFAFPHPYFSPHGLACHSDLGPSLFVYEKYGVQQLRFEPDPTHPNLWNQREGEAAEEQDFGNILHECFGHDHEFRKSGIQSVSVDCRDETCALVFLGKSGDGDHQEVRWCHVPALGAVAADAGGAGTEGAAADPKAPKEPPKRPANSAAKVFGGPWQAISDTKQGVWALHESAPVKLKWLDMEDKSRALAPDTKYAGGSNRLGQIHVLSNSVVLGLERVPQQSADAASEGAPPRSQLYAWDTKKKTLASSFFSWRLPSETEWRGVCSAHGALYLLGLTRRGKFQIWRSALPEEIATGELGFGRGV